MTKGIQILPIGTVVMLKNSSSAIMIAGYLAESEAKPGYIWDYSGFLYPVGMRDGSEVYTFDQGQIEEIYALGYQDGESFGFIQHIQKAAAKLAEKLEGLEQQGKEGKKDV